MVSVCCSVKGQCGSIVGVLVVAVEAKLRLDSCTMDTEAMQTLPRSLGQLHVLFATVGVDRECDLKVQAGDNLGIGKLPDVNVMAADDTRKTFDILTDFGDRNVLWSRL